MSPVPVPAAKLMRWATYASVSVACLLIAGKFYAWLVTDSVSLLSTLIDSMIDAAASVISLIAVRHALEPADREHRFGHGKAEALAGLAQSAFIVGSAMFLLVEAVQRLFNPKNIEHTDIGYEVMAASIALTTALILFQRYVVRQTGSVAISADSTHYQTDILTNISVVFSLFLVSHFGVQWADPLIAIGIAFFILYSAWQIAHEVLQILMDRELPDEDRQRIREIALAVDGVKGVHDLRTRSSGIQTFIQLHLQISGEMKLVDAHRIADAVELQVSAAFRNAEVIAHQDPDGIDEDHYDFN